MDGSRLRKAPRSCEEDDATLGRTSASWQWADIPQDLAVLLCHCLGHAEVLKLLAANKRARDIGVKEEVWRFFCRIRWGRAANLHVYRSAKDLFRDCNGWFPRASLGGRGESLPSFEVHRLTLHESPCLTMDLRITEEDIIAVSEAPRSKHGRKKASVHILDTASGERKSCFEVSEATINCCDVGPGLICTGSDDSKVRIFRRSSSISSSCSSRCGADGSCCGSNLHDGTCSGNDYVPAGEFLCRSTVNDLRFAREDTVIAVRTQQNRHPVGLDLIPLGRPDTRISFPGGSWATRGKFIHALDGFEEGCSLSGVACSGEHPLTSAFSAMLFDFRRPAPCVVDLPVTSVRTGHPVGTMLWPLRAGQSPKVYANLLHEEGQKHNRGTIAMVDFRYPAPDSGVRFNLPDPVDDFRCFSGNIYAACTDTSDGQSLRLHRCDPNLPGVSECLCTVVEAYDAGGRSPREDLKVFSICPRGFAVSYGEQLALGAVKEARRPIVATYT
eukprot:TRINITY_DN95564_c0_g1_i1.p1 TRINITY_DN95564_c0_g1~~TRINITY_DN95564_c0_g1_i1.p1  ORF type:complete len:500 (-),score=67.56 TRINITY_DN95564_c0_g1_i1:71-1570(-)